MSEEQNSSEPGFLKIVAIVATVWNAVGCAYYLMYTTSTPAQLADGNAELEALFANVATWAMAGFALGVWFGLAGSIALLMRKSWASIAFLISLIGILMQQIHNYFMTNMLDIMGMGAIVFPTMVLIIAIYLLILSNQGKQEGWLK